MKLTGKWQTEQSSAPKEEVPFAIGEVSVPGGSDQPSHALMGQDRRILIVDDNPVVLKAFEMKLKSLGFQVLVATEGAKAVSVVRDDAPDIIVLDINFPPESGAGGLHWNGFSIMQWMQRFQDESAIPPVIIITGGDPAKYKDRALASGAAAFFHKPINNAEFLLTIQELLKKNPPRKQKAKS